jgi:hypothetical protein
MRYRSTVRSGWVTDRTSRPGAAQAAPPPAFEETFADARGPSAFWFGMADAHSDWQINDHVHQATGMIAEQFNCDVSEARAG